MSTAATSTNRSKSLFKKPKKRKCPSQNRRSKLQTSDDEEEGQKVGAVEKDEGVKTIVKGEQDSDVKEEETDDVNGKEELTSSSTLDKIRAIKKSRKLKSFVRTQVSIKKVKRDNNDHDQEDDNEAIEKEANKDLKERLDGTFASTKLGGGGGYDDDDDEDGGILRKKHKLAMEQYITNQMEDRKMAADKSGEKGVSFQGDNHVVRDKKDLYAQLLKSSAVSLAGAGTSNVTNSDPQEGDMGAGGAMLGGTGIAEVIIPVEDKIKNIKQTEMALAKKQDMQRRRAMALKTISSAGTDVLSEDVSNLGASYAHNFRLHNSEWIEQKKQQGKAQYEAMHTQKKSEGDNEENEQRIGFNAKRGLVSEKGKDGHAQLHNHGGRHERSTDDARWRNFVRKVKR
mmetsp:Transcript_1560/g.2226  ORF Transcript_1560/g.2226 Transcript_1560/m.2226 type:complete len:398 (+) Transcript_1560:68-1261(+)|eukprot:CAMPEP_0203674670 /NCGR_PEP_ID=MMETSP0090-20130426/16818_1 /ASSEMBLY_ACC=CAM_ASM_001088 /TAXON_ID=426623 /ORGANISM="Chaetoceros affinis, Strain CCMP159" /LENGTH=397 /DNA_ID=CAMNT_0050540609 /DNA_START=52 /DNA_END=1245 /DNA_ORIENTATION=-